MNQEFYTALSDMVKVQLEEPMSKHTTFRVGGGAEYYVSISSEADLKKGIALCKEYGVSYIVLGNGSNVLVSDQGIKGVVFQLDSNFAEVTYDRVNENGEENWKVTAKAGAMLSVIGAQCLKQSITGFEWAAGIPGTVGGAVYMNAGAYGGEMKDIITEVTVLTKDGEIEKRTVEQLDLSYRHSALMAEEAYVLEAVFQLKAGDVAEIKATMDDLSDKRRSKQPLEYPSAGSTFKRPVGYFAGKLIEDAGLRGYQVGGAQVSEKHCGFVINKDHATATDIYQLTEDVKKIVLEKFGVEMEREIRLIGEFE